MLYIAARKINAKSIRLPIIVSNNETNKEGIANITNHNVINSVIKPTTRLRFFFENNSLNEKDIIIYVFKKK
jgi:hypothetical protein